MEVDRIAFAPRLLEILEDLSVCHFVAIDLELTGIATRAINASGRQSLQERYRDIKEAAERYQILQIGLTFAIHNDEGDSYVLKPYNFNLNPLVEERLDIERIFSVQSSAVEFLLRHDFKLEKPFKDGVPYLSHEEAARAKEIAYNRLKRKHIEDIHLNEDEKESLAFLVGVRIEIDQWKNTGVRELDITSRTKLGGVAQEPQPINLDWHETTPQPEGDQLSRFEKRLVHQLVRAEYPDLVTLGREGYITIIHLDEEREKEILKKKKHGVKQQIVRQTGFRWIVDAMTHRTLHRIDVKSFAYYPDTGAAKFVDLRALTCRFDRAKELIKKKKTVLVGHNCFTDFVYFYKTFIGPLPETVEEFQQAFHELFPLAVDTKYLATHNCGDINPASSLQEIEVRLQSQRRPFVYSHKDHRKYADAEAFHEAGFDAYLTALVMLRLSSKLEAEGNYAERVDTPTQVIEQSMASASTQAQSQPSESSTLTWNTANNADVVDSSTTPVAQENPVVAVKKKKKRRGRGRFKKRAGSSSDDPWTSRFSHDTMFDKLSNLSMEDSDKIESDEGANDSPTPNTSPLSSEKHSTPVKDKMAEMPPFNSDFWQIYGNKLRMFGTKEGVFHLA